MMKQESTDSKSFLSKNTKSDVSVFAKMFRRQPLGLADSNSNSRAEGSGLQRVLTAKDLIGFGIASTVGSGIFVISGTAGEHAGPGLFLSFIIGGVCCLFSGLCYCEFSTRILVAGSAYTYAYCSFGEIVGFLIGWNLTLEYGISAATIAQGLSSYMKTFLQDIGISKQYLSGIMFGYNINEYFTINIFAGLMIMVCTLLIIYGIRESSRFTNFITLWNLLLITTFIISGIFYIDSDNWFNPCDNNKYDTYCDENESNTMLPNGITGVFEASGLVFFSYVGFDGVSSLAEETINPNVTMSIGILVTLLISTSLYVFVSIVLLGMVPFTALDETSPLSDAFKLHNNNTIATLVAFGALTTTAATTLTCMIGQPRIFYKMSKDGLFYQLFGQIHETYKTPHWGSLISGIIAAIIAMFINFNLLAEMISVGTLMAYTLVCAGVIVLRYPKMITVTDNIDADIPGGGAGVSAAKPVVVEHEIDEKVTLVVVLLSLFSILLGFATNLNKNWTSMNGLLIVTIILIIIVVAIFCKILTFNFQRKEYIPDDIFKCPLCPIVPSLGIFINSFVIASLKWESFVRIIVWFIIGVIIYIFYGSKHSKLNENICNESSIGINDQPLSGRLSSENVHDN